PEGIAWPSPKLPTPPSSPELPLSSRKVPTPPSLAKLPLSSLKLPLSPPPKPPGCLLAHPTENTHPAPTAHEKSRISHLRECRGTRTSYMLQVQVAIPAPSV